MSSKFQVHILLKDHPADLAELEEFARNPARTTDDCHDWLMARGYTLSRTAVYRWKSSFDLTDRFRAANELAGSLMSNVAQEQGSVKLAAASNVALHQMLFTQLLRLQNAGENGSIPPKDMLAMAAAHKAASQTTGEVEELKAKQRAAVVAAETKAKAGGSATDVLSVIKQTLGITAPAGRAA